MLFGVGEVVITDDEATLTRLAIKSGLNIHQLFGAAWV
jgi:hypothetical protein